LGDAGFLQDKQSICKLAYYFAEKLQIKYNLDYENQDVGDECFKSYIEQNLELSIRQVEGLSVARVEGLSREKMSIFHERCETCQFCNICGKK
ncbi:hypothetical protein HHI36_004499, partial [Cryptolaemus montrouzieri]